MISKEPPNSENSNQTTLSYSQSPNVQSLFRFQNGSWLPIQSPASSSTLSAGQQTFPELHILTWNVDFASHSCSERLKAALDHVESCLTPPTGSTTTSTIIPAVIMLQEIHAFAFPALLEHPFVRDHYDITDINPGNFAKHYGTVTFLPKPLTPFVASISRLRFRSLMGRDALTVDLDLPRTGTSDVLGRPSTIRLRLVNTHLESLLSGTALRPEQLATVSNLLHAVDGGLVSGDMNPITEADVDLPEQVDLKDCWKVLKATARPEDGYTWGYQPRGRYPPCRMDKILFTGVLRPISIERTGIGLSTEVFGESHWVSDHYGLLATLAIE